MDGVGDDPVFWCGDGETSAPFGYDYNQRRKHEKKALVEFEAVLSEEDTSGSLQGFLLGGNRYDEAY
jgi:hypothetical protein